MMPAAFPINRIMFNRKRGRCDAAGKQRWCLRARAANVRYATCCLFSPLKHSDPILGKVSRPHVYG